MHNTNPIPHQWLLPLCLLWIMAILAFVGVLVFGAQPSVDKLHKHSLELQSSIDQKADKPDAI